jgi:hypothetical protein
MACWNHPFEVARIEAQARAAAGQPALSMPNVMRMVVAESGVTGLFTGLVPRVMLGIWQTLFMVTGACGARWSMRVWLATAAIRAKRVVHRLDPKLRNPACHAERRMTSLLCPCAPARRQAGEGRAGREMRAQAARFCSAGAGCELCVAPGLSAATRVVIVSQTHTHAAQTTWRHAHGRVRAQLSAELRHQIRSKLVIAARP